MSASRPAIPIPPPVGASPTEAELVTRYWDRLRVFATRRLRDAAAAEDVAQETLRRVVEALRAGRVEQLEALPGFVFRTAMHICQQRQRSSGREERALHRLASGVLGESEQPDPLAALITEERCTEVRQAMERLTDADRELLRLIYYEMLDTSEIATRLAITPAALRVRKHRTLHRLAALLGARAP